MNGSARGPLAALSFGNFVVGTGTIIIAGLLNIMAADLGTSAAAIGQLIAAYGVAVCFGVPIFAALISRIDRRPSWSRRCCGSRPGICSRPRRPATVRSWLCGSSRVSARRS